MFYLQIKKIYADKERCLCFRLSPFVQIEGKKESEEVLEKVKNMMFTCAGGWTEGDRGQCVPICAFLF